VKDTDLKAAGKQDILVYL